MGNIFSYGPVKRDDIVVELMPVLLECLLDVAEIMFEFRSSPSEGKVDSICIGCPDSNPLSFGVDATSTEEFFTGNIEIDIGT